MSLFVMEYRYADLDARARVRPDHLAYMQSLYQDGTVVFAGPVGDGSGAMVLLQVGSEDEAEEVVMGDPTRLPGWASTMCCDRGTSSYRPSPTRCARPRGRLPGRTATGRPVSG